MSAPELLPLCAGTSSFDVPMIAGVVSYCTPSGVDHAAFGNADTVAASSLGASTATTPARLARHAVRRMRPTAIVVDASASMNAGVTRGTTRFDVALGWTSDAEAKLGEKQLWIVKNDSDWDHPFHLHGFFFQVVDERGEALRPLALKDTVNVPMKSTVRLLVTFDERPGEWMFHCHILDHAEGGLMGTVLVGDVPAANHVHGRQDK